MDFEVTTIAYLVLVIVALIPSILCVVLFFKIWGMTNDTKAIKETLDVWLDLEHPLIENHETKLNERK